MEDIALGALRSAVSRAIEGQRRLAARLDRFAKEMHDVRSWLGSLEQNYARLSPRLDRLANRIEQIEQRLDLMLH